MKNLKIYAIIITLAVLVSCNTGLQRYNDNGKGNVSFSMELNGQTVSQPNARTIGVSLTPEVFKDFTFTVSLTNTDDSSKNLNKSGDFSWLSTYVSCITLDKGSWTIKVNAANSDKTVKIEGSASFTVGGKQSIFTLKLIIGGTAKGVIEFDTKEGKVSEEYEVNLCSLDKYLAGNYTTNDVTIFVSPQKEESEERKYSIKDTPVPSIIVLEDITPGQYFLWITQYGTEICGDVAYVYPGLVSKGSKNEGKYNLYLEYGYPYETIELDDGSTIQNTCNVIPFDSTYNAAYLPGYGSNDETGLEPIHPGYNFTGWYDSKEAAIAGKNPSVPLDKKFITMQTEPESGIYNVGDRTLYAGWKKADLPDDFLTTEVIIKNKTNSVKLQIGTPGNYFSKKGGAIDGAEEQYVAIGTKVFFIRYNELYYVDVAELTEDTDYYNEDKIKKMELPEFNLPSLQADPIVNEIQAIYYDNNGNLYGFCNARLQDGGDIWNLLKISIPSSSGQLPVASVYAVEGIEQGEQSQVGANVHQDDIDDYYVSVKNLAVYGNTLFLNVFMSYTDYNNSDNNWETKKIVAFDINDVSTMNGVAKTFYGKNKSISTSDIYAPTKYCVDGYNRDVFSTVYIRDMYADESAVYILFSDTTVAPNEGHNHQSILVSTGALAALDYDLTITGVYGKAEKKQPEEDFETLTVSHSYDQTCFAQPYKILAIYDRKLLIQECGTYLYLKPNDEYYYKKFLNRVSVFDLDRKCITYTQLTNLDIMETSSLMSPNTLGTFSIFDWDN